MGKNHDHELSLLATKLEGIERRFGGAQTGVERRKVSPYDPRTAAALGASTMRGGGRMNLHGYAAHYAAHLQPFLKKPDLVVVELGVLRGSGLALLCEVFPKARRIIGLEVDPSHYHEHKPILQSLGAFKKCKPEVHTYDELAPDAPQRLAAILGGDRVDLFIHDALHYDGAIVATLEHTTRHFGKPFRCFIEDNHTVAPSLRQLYGAKYAVEARGRLTVLWGDG
jgi:hypothetical protein